MCFSVSQLSLSVFSMGGCSTGYPKVRIVDAVNLQSLTPEMLTELCETLQILVCSINGRALL
jgi:hypothetical protein